MTLSASTSTVSYQGNGSTVSFPFAFEVLSASHLVVTLTDTTQSPVVVTAMGSSSYSVSGIGSSTGGTVTLNGALSNGVTITISRVVPFVQNTSIVNQGGFYPDVLEGALDYLTMEVQQLAAALVNVVSVPVGSGLNPASYLTTVQSMTTQTIAALSSAQAAALAAAASQASAAASAAAAAARAQPAPSTSTKRPSTVSPSTPPTSRRPPTCSPRCRRLTIRTGRMSPSCREQRHRRFRTHRGTRWR